MKQSFCPSYLTKERVFGKLPTINSKAFLGTYKQSLLALSFNFGAMFAGALLTIYFDILSQEPWSLAVYPGILSMRGVIGGLFSGRLSTSLHVGTIKASFSKNTGDFYLMWRTLFVQTIESSIILGSTASLFGVLFWGTTVQDSATIISVVTASIALSIVIISPITIAISILSFRRGLNPDIIVYPIISTIADVFVTVCYIFILSIRSSLSQSGYFFMTFLNSIFLVLALYIFFHDFDKKDFIKTLRESLLTLVLVAFIVNITGSFLSRIKFVETRHEIYIVYPAIIDTMGSVGAIVGSTATTKLALGTLTSSFTSIKRHSNEIISTWIASLMMFTLYSLSSLVLQGSLHRFLTVLYITNLLATSCMIIISYTIGIATYRRGLDPDNFVIPIVSSLADTITTLALFFSLNLISLSG
jgi:mgtE-like transporter